MQVEDWLRDQGLGKYADRFAEQEIGFDVLGALTDGDLREIGLPIGARKRFLKAVADIGIVRPPREDQGERRQITVLFCDLVEYTALSSEMDPEDLQGLMSAFVETCRDEVMRWGGQVGNYLGDGVLVYFGWPQAYEDAPERAAHAALALVRAIGGLKTATGVPLKVRVGMATGLVLVGRKLDAGGGEVDTVFGTTPNLAARLETFAAPGEVMLDANTAALLSPSRFSTRDLGEHGLKGIALPTHIWRLEAAQRRDFPRAGQVARLGQAPIEGRDGPLGLLERCWWSVAAGEGMRLVTLKGEAGIGKSHLSAHFLRQCRAAGGRGYELQCWPYNDNATLYPVVAWLYERAGVRPDAPVTRRDAAFAALAARTGQQPQDYLAALGDLLDIAPTPPDQSAERRRAAWFAAITAEIRGLCAKAPLLLLFEDVHWSDPLTDRLIGELAENCADLPLMILATTRPRGEPSWGTRPRAEVLELSRVDRAAAERMVDQLAAGRVLMPGLRNKIVDATDGVPLFIAELTRDVLDRAGPPGESGETLNIPATLQGVLSARLDSAQAAKPVAQVASCIGRVFDPDLLARATGRTAEDIARRIDTLAALALIEPLDDGTPRYIFRHALIQEAAYQSQPRSRRRTRHSSIADALLSSDAEDARQIANHLTAANRFAEAVERWKEAGARAARRSAQGEAIEHYRRALDLLGKLPPGPEQDRTRLSLLLALGPVLSAHDGYAADCVGRAYAEAAPLADRVGRASDRFAVRRGLWLYRQMAAQYEGAEEVAQEMLALTGRDGTDPASVLEANRAIGATAFMRGKLDTARLHLEAAIEGYSSGVGTGNTARYGDDPGLACMAYLSSTLWYLGHPDEARTCCANLLDIARRVGHPFSLARSLTFSAFTYHLMRDYELLLPTAERAAHHADRFKFPFHAGVGRILWGWALCRQGHFDDGWPIMEQGMRDYERSGSHMMQPLYFTLLAELFGDRGDDDRAWRYSQEAMSLLDRSQEDLVKPEVLRVHGELLARAGEPGGALEVLGAAAALAHDQNSRFCHLRALVAATRLDPQRAPALAEALAWFPEGLRAQDLELARALLEQTGSTVP